ncbi:MAG TPA: hypothetical protein VG939_04370 [Caulobacteraceae bacterium]|nr:hypothetical protein [Caulobacteraceae bacterium]
MCWTLARLAVFAAAILAGLARPAGRINATGIGEPRLDRTMVALGAPLLAATLAWSLKRPPLRPSDPAGPA